MLFDVDTEDKESTMKPPAMKATITIGTDKEIHVGPFYTRKPLVIERRIPSLLRRGYIGDASSYSPELVSRLIEASEITISDCGICEAHCFASARIEHIGYIPASRHVRNIPALRELLRSESGSGWSHFVSPKDQAAMKKSEQAGAGDAEEAV